MIEDEPLPRSLRVVRLGEVCVRLVERIEPARTAADATVFALGHMIEVEGADADLDHDDTAHEMSEPSPSTMTTADTAHAMSVAQTDQRS
jgi:hypothetical protein